MLSHMVGHVSRENNRHVFSLARHCIQMSLLTRRIPTGYLALFRGHDHAYVEVNPFCWSCLPMGTASSKHEIKLGFVERIYITYLMLRSNFQRVGW